MRLTDNELSKKLDELADRLESAEDHNGLVADVIQELRQLSVARYTPSSTTWGDLKGNVPTNPRSKRYPF